MPLTTALLLSGLLVPGFTGCEDEPDPYRVQEPGSAARRIDGGLSVAEMSTYHQETGRLR